MCFRYVLVNSLVIWLSGLNDVPVLCSNFTIASPVCAFDWCQRPWVTSTSKWHYALCCHGYLVSHFILRINECFEYKLLSLTYKLLTTSQPDYLHNLTSVQSSGRTRSSSVVTLARPSVSSSLQISNRSFRYASPHLWNQLPFSFRQPHCVHSPPGSPHPAHITSSQSSPSFSPSVTPSTFHSRLKTHLFHKSFPP